MNSNNENTTTFTVEIDSVLEPIVPDFLDNRKKDCQMIHQLLENGSFSEIRTIGHRMKGAGGSYGFDDISEIGEIIEEASLKTDHGTVRTALLRLVDYLERVSVRYVS